MFICLCSGTSELTTSNLNCPIKLQCNFLSCCKTLSLEMSTNKYSRINKHQIQKQLWITSRKSVRCFYSHKLAPHETVVLAPDLNFVLTSAASTYYLFQNQLPNSPRPRRSNYISETSPQLPSSLPTAGILPETPESQFHQLNTFPQKDIKTSL